MKTYNLTDSERELIAALCGFYEGEINVSKDERVRIDALLHKLDAPPVVTVDDREAEDTTWSCPTCGTRVEGLNDERLAR